MEGRGSGDGAAGRPSLTHGATQEVTHSNGPWFPARKAPSGTFSGAAAFALSCGGLHSRSPSGQEGEETLPTPSVRRTASPGEGVLPGSEPALRSRQARTQGLPSALSALGCSPGLSCPALSAAAALGRGVGQPSRGGAAAPGRGGSWETGDAAVASGRFSLGEGTGVPRRPAEPATRASRLGLGEPGALSRRRPGRAGTGEEAGS